MVSVTRKVNLKALIERRFDGSNQDAAREIGVTPGRISQLTDPKQAFGERAARKIEESLSLPDRWLDQDHAAQSPKGGPPLGGPRTGGGVAQLLTLGPDTVVPRIVDEESVLSGEAQDRVFRLLVKDASAGPDYPKGAHIIWSRDRRAQPGRLVLVRDKHRQLHIRRMQQGRAPDTWVAAPLNPDYAMLDSIADGLEVVATFDGFQLPPDEV